MSRRKTITFTIILLVVVFVLATRDERVQRGDNDFALITKLDAGEGRSVWILLDDEPFEISSWSYEIHVNDQIVVQTPTSPAV